jgi:hypothetical protein
LLIYSPHITPRLEYICSILLPAVGISSFQITGDLVSFSSYNGPRINYSEAVINEAEIQLTPATLLFEECTKPQPLQIFKWKDLPVFYKSSGKDLPFDLFAASFYLLSRYEEYLPHAQDIYGRYTHENSIAYKHNFLNIPLINLWLREFSQMLTQRFPALGLQHSAFSFLPTYDIDIAWSYSNKSLLRNVGGLLRSITVGDWPKVSERVKVLLFKKQDPFDSYEWMERLHADTGVKPYYFFLLAKRNKGSDKNVLPSNKRLRELINDVAAKYFVGIHPSWQSGDKEETLTAEINTLRMITKQPISKSRQHYIRMMLPGTYRKLIAAGITEDYSMGYGSINGFRASYCLPYKWYDLEKETPTSLVIYPFCYMEANSFYEQKLCLNEAEQELEHYYQATKNVNGLLITIWHNHLLGTDKMFAGWRELYEQFIRKHFSA